MNHGTVLILAGCAVAALTSLCVVLFILVWMGRKDHERILKASNLASYRRGFRNGLRVGRADGDSCSPYRRFLPRTVVD